MKKEKSKTYCSSSKSLLDAVKVSNWAPTFSNKTFLGNIKVKHVKCVVNCFYLSHFNEPNFNVLCCSYQNTMTVILGLPKNLNKNSKPCKTSTNHNKKKSLREIKLSLRICHQLKEGINIETPS